MDMTINYKNIISEILKQNNVAAGNYDIIIDTPFISPMLSMIFDNCNDNSIFGKLVVNNDCTFELYNYRPTRVNNSDDIHNLFTLLTNDIATLKPSSNIIKYFYFDDSFQLREAKDKGDDLAKKRKEEHNYFESDSYDERKLADSIKNHIRNMRLNLLANFHPEANA